MARPLETAEHRRLHRSRRERAPRSRAPASSNELQLDHPDWTAVLGTDTADTVATRRGVLLMVALVAVCGAQRATQWVPSAARPA